MTGLVTFTLTGRSYATPLTSVREVVRLEGLTDLPGMAPPLAGVLVLRGAALPVLDLRRGSPGAPGDVLVIEQESASGPSALGIAVDAVRAVVDAGELAPAGGSSGVSELPGYVLDVLRDDDGAVFLVDLAAMVASARQVAA